MLPTTRAVRLNHFEPNLFKGITAAGCANGNGIDANLLGSGESPHAFALTTGKRQRMPERA
jgi:hypothetical protein